MTGDTPLGTRALRRASRRELRHAPASIRKAHRKATKTREALSYRIVALLWVLVCMYGIIPLVISSVGTDARELPGFWRAAPFAGLLLAVFALRSVQTRFSDNMETFFSRVFPVAPATLTRRMTRLALLDVFSISLFYSVNVFWFLILSPSSLMDSLAWSTLHGMGLFLTTLLLLGLPVKLPAMPLAGVLAGLWLVRIFAADSFPGMAAALDLLAALLPVGWVARAQEAWEAGRVALTAGFLAPLLPAAWMGRAFLARYSRAYGIYLMESEWGVLEEMAAPREPNTAKDRAPDTGFFEGPFRAAWTWVPADKVLFLRFLTGGSVSLGKPHPAMLGLLAAGGVLLAVPTLLVRVAGLICLTLALLLSIPLFGGSWPGLKPEILPHGQDFVPALYPLELRELFSLMLRVNRTRFLLALPAWVFAAVCLGLTFVTLPKAFLLLGLLWSTALGWQTLATWSQLIQYGARPVRGKFWRGAVYGLGNLFWVLLVLAAVGLAVMCFLGLPMFGFWLLVFMGMTLTGEFIARIQLADCTGNAYDFHIRNVKR